MSVLVIVDVIVNVVADEKLLLRVMTEGLLVLLVANLVVLV